MPYFNPRIKTHDRNKARGGIIFGSDRFILAALCYLFFTLAS